MLREPEGTKVVKTYLLAAALTNADEMNMDVQKCSGYKDTSGPLSSLNPPISVAASKPLSSDMDSRYLFPTKTTYFA